MKSILTNIVKITVAAVLTILCAQALKLDFAVYAGIVAILSVQSTKKRNPAHSPCPPSCLCSGASNFYYSL